MRIALAAPTPLPARRANTVQVMKQAQALVRLGHDLHLAAPGEPPAGEPWAALQAHYGLNVQFPVRWLPVWAPLRSYDYAFQAVGWALSLQAELLWTRHPQTAALAAGLGVRTIYEIHDLPHGRTAGWLLRRSLTGRGTRRLAVITQALADALQAQFPHPAYARLLRIAPDGVDLERYADLPEPVLARRQLVERGAVPGLNPSRFTAGYTGHLYAGRGAELLLELARRLPEINFLLVGGEPQDVERLRVQADGLPNLFLTGFVPNADLPRYQAACEALLMPYQERVSASSGGDIGRFLSPMKLFEYLACGRVILSSNLPVFGEVLADGENAVLLPPADVTAWAQTLAELPAEPARRARLSAAARQTAARYTWEARTQTVLEGLE